jgi:serralysin
MATLIGTAGNDPLATLLGGNDADIILGLGGNDVITGGNNADFLIGGGGDDNFRYLLAGEAGDGLGNFDYIEGGDGIDTISVQSSQDFKGVTLSSIERIDFFDTATDDFRFVGVSASQIGNGGFATNLRLKGDVDADVLQVNMGNVSSLNLYNFQFVNWTNGATTFAGDRVQINGDGDSETIVGTTRNDYIEGAGGADRLYGGLGIDFLDGGEGNDVLYAGDGNDSMSGGAGADIYVFDSAPNSATNVDKINDFSVADDTIWMKKAIFTGLGAVGTLTANQFKTIGIPGGTVDADDRVIYDRGNGFLYYDANGSAAGGAAKIAELQTGLIMTNADFYVFA